MHGSGKSSSGTAIGAIIVIILLLAMIGSCNRPSKEAEQFRFQQQMQKDPATWTKQERDYFNAFMEWSDKN